MVAGVQVRVVTAQEVVRAGGKAGHVDQAIWVCKCAIVCMCGCARPSEGHEFAVIARAASVSTSSCLPSQRWRSWLFVGLVFQPARRDPCSGCGPGVPRPKTGREEALLLGVEIRLRGSRDAVAAMWFCQRRPLHRKAQVGLRPGVSSPSIQTQMRQDEVTTLTMQPQPLYLFTPTPLHLDYRTQVRATHGCCCTAELTCVLLPWYSTGL